MRKIEKYAVSHVPHFNHVLAHNVLRLQGSASYRVGKNNSRLVCIYLYLLSSDATDKNSFNVKLNIKK